MIITENQEAYLHQIAPQAFNGGHFALLELKDAGETKLTRDGKELGRLALNGTKDCTVIMWDEPVEGFKIFAFEIDI